MSELRLPFVLTNSQLRLGLYRHLMSKKQTLSPRSFNMPFTSPWILEGCLLLTRSLLFGYLLVIR